MENISFDSINLFSHSAFCKSEEDGEDSWNWEDVAFCFGPLLAPAALTAAAPAALTAAGFTAAGRTLFSDQFLF